MRLRLKHSLGFKSVVSVYAPTEMCEIVDEIFYAKLDSVLDQYPHRDAVIYVGANSEEDINSKNELWGEFNV